MLNDPYTTMTWDTDLLPTDSLMWLKIEYLHIYNYLISTCSPYTKDELKAYKSTEGYKYFVDDWVRNLLVHQIPNGSGHEEQVTVVRASVRHSQWLSDTPLRARVVVEVLRTVLCAHYTCMGGLGEACLHIAAVLFALESNTRISNILSIISEPCAWLVVNSQNGHMLLFQILTSQFQHWKEFEWSVKVLVTGVAVLLAAVPILPHLNQLMLNYQKLSKTGKPVLLSLVPDFCNAYIPRCEKGIWILPFSLTEIFREEILEETYVHLLEKYEQTFDDISITSDQTHKLEETTRNQTWSKL